MIDKIIPKKHVLTAAQGTRDTYLGSLLSGIAGAAGQWISDGFGCGFQTIGF